MDTRAAMTALLALEDIHQFTMNATRATAKSRVVAAKANATHFQSGEAMWLNLSYERKEKRI